VPINGEQHRTIDLESEKQPPLEKLDSLSPAELKLLKEYVDEILQNVKIHSSKSST